MHRFFATVPVILALLVAGCLGGEGPTPSATLTPEGPYYDVSKPLSIGYNASECQEAVVLALVDITVAQKPLPQGWKAKDAQGIFGLPLAAGKGAVFLNANRCAKSQLATGGTDEGQIAVYIEAPKVEGVAPIEADFYELARFTSKEENLLAFKAIGWNVFEGQPNLQVTPQATGGALANGDVRNDEGIVQHTMGMTALHPTPFDLVGRFWHDTELGLAYVEYQGGSIPASDGGGSCTLRAGPAKEAFGFDACPRETTSVVFWQPFKVTSTIVSLPNATIG